MGQGGGEMKEKGALLQKTPPVGLLVYPNYLWVCFSSILSWINDISGAVNKYGRTIQTRTRIGPAAKGLLHVFGIEVGKGFFTQD